MKICFTLSGIYAGGAEKVVISLANYFSSIGIDSTIILISTDSSNTFHKVDERVKIIPLLKIKNCKYFKKISLLRDVIKEISPDIVISFLHHVCIYTYLAIRKTGIPIICSERNDPHRYNLLTKAILKYVFNHSNGCVFQTKDAQKWYFRSKDKKNVAVINNPVVLNSGIVQSREHENRAVFVGRLSKQKNYKLLIKSFVLFKKKYPNFSLVIFGEGEGKKYIKKYSKRHHVFESIVFRGNDFNWQNEAKNCKLFLSTSKYEGMPNSLAEAASLGLICVATNCPIGGSKMLSESFKNILLVPSKNIQQFAQEMDHATNIENFEPGIPESFTIKSVGKRWLYLIQSLLEEKL